jgi:plastocyanin
MKSTSVRDVLVVVSILGGLLFGGLSVGFTATDKAGAQMMGPGMMGPGMMGPGMMQNGGFFNTFPYTTGNRTGSIPISPLIGRAMSRVHISLSNASINAEEAVGTNSHAVSGGLGTQLGYLAYTVWVADSNYRTFHMVTVDAGNGKVLSNQPVFGSSFGMMGSMMMGPGMMMYRGTPYPNLITNSTSGVRPSSGMIVTIVTDAQNMGDKAFQPNPVSTKVGGTLTWVNSDTLDHTVTSGNGPNDPNVGTQFNSGVLAQGQTFAHTFKKAGEFNYFCQLHPNMVGEVIVK